MQKDKSEKGTKGGRSTGEKKIDDNEVGGMVKIKKRQGKEISDR